MKIDLENCKKIRDDTRKTVTISVSTTKARSKWLSDNDLSPTKVFNKAIEALGFGEKK